MANEEPERQEAERFIKRRLDRIELLYGQVINRLWLAHGAAAGVTISILSTHADRKYNQLLLPLVMFVGGLALLALSDLLLMIKDAKAVKRNQSAFSMLDVFIADIEAPLERIGMKGFRLVAQSVSAVLLILGLVIGFFLFWRLR